MGINFLSEEQAQISAELIIVLAAVVAVVLLFVSNIQNFSKDAASTANTKFNSVKQAIDQIA